jgi:DNA mismatch repair protein MutL
MPPEMVDVNVHPTKLEVRFQDGGGLYGQLLGTLRRKFLSTDLEARYQHGKISDADDATARAEQSVETRRELAQWAQAELAKQTTDASAVPTAANLAARPEEQLHFRMESPAPRMPLTLNRIDPPASNEQAVAQRYGAFTQSPAESPREGPHFTSSHSALQVHNRYLVAESDDGMIVIDQHALHERILYEQIREKVLAGEVESQNLLVPEPVDLGPAEAAAALEHRELLARLGLTVEAFGGDTLLVSSYPAMLANISPAEVLRDLIERLLEGGRSPEPRDLLDSLLHSISCKAAIKAGDRLSAGEIEALVEQRHLAQDAHHCPHGRPTALIFTRDELDRQFKRI